MPLLLNNNKRKLGQAKEHVKPVLITVVKNDKKMFEKRIT